MTGGTVNLEGCDACNCKKPVKTDSGGCLCTCSHPFTSAIAKGNVYNHSSFYKIGYHASVGGTEVDLTPYLSGLYTWPTGATTMTVESTDNADDKTGGAGAQELTLYYLTTGFIEKSKTVALDGTTPVEIATDIYRINYTRVTKVGANKKPTGEIKIMGGATQYSGIRIGKNRASQLIYTVPYGKVVYINQIAFGASAVTVNKVVSFYTRATFDDRSKTVLEPGFFQDYSEIVLYNASMDRTLDPPTRFPAGVDLKISAIATDSTAIATCSIRGWIETL